MFVRISILVAFFLLALSCNPRNFNTAETKQSERTLAEVLKPFPHAPAKARYIADNNESWAQRIKIIKAAQHEILIKYFIIDPDPFGFAFLGALLEKIEQGVKVKINLDVRGTLSFTTGLLGESYLQVLVHKGAEIKAYSPILWNIRELNEVARSDHDKMIFVDKKYFLTGGRNIADEYFLEYEDMPESYFDADALYEFEPNSPLIPLVEKAFYREFNSSKARAIRALDASSIDTAKLKGIWTVMKAKMEGRSLDSSHALKDLISKYNEAKKISLYKSVKANMPSPDPTDPVLMTVLDNSITDTQNAKQITHTIMQLIRSSKKEIKILNPYVILTPEMIASLRTAGQNGVKITLMTNGPLSTDSSLPQSVFQNEWEDLESKVPNIKIMAATGAKKIHAKIFTFDEEVAVVGSFNMDYMSDRINSEITSVVQDRHYTKQVNAYMNEIERTQMFHITRGSHPNERRDFSDMPGVTPAMIQNLNKVYERYSRHLRERL